jgi:hypothetical protein
VETQEITYHVVLKGFINNGTGYVNYVFENLEFQDYDYHYITAVRFPNWDCGNIKVGERGYVLVKYVQEGKDEWYDKETKEFNKYVDDEEERVDKATEILLDSELYLVDDPCFTVKSLITTIKDYCLSKQVKTVCFDYISNNGYIARELSANSGIPQREDMILLALTDHLKQIQRECGISLITSCQSNGNEDNTEFPTESCLAGSKGQVRKTDGTMAMFPPTKKELQQTELIRARVCSKFGFQNDPYFVNNVVHIIKGRNSEYPKHIKVFQHVDLGTGRSIDLFCTDKNNEPFKVKKLIIEVDE